jgi:hypothetical protein
MGEARGRIGVERPLVGAQLGALSGLERFQDTDDATGTVTFRLVQADLDFL